MSSSKSIPNKIQNIMFLPPPLFLFYCSGIDLRGGQKMLSLLKDVCSTLKIQSAPNEKQSLTRHWIFFSPSQRCYL